jgi:hypothetical protein
VNESIEGREGEGRVELPAEVEEAIERALPCRQFYTRRCDPVHDVPCDLCEALAPIRASHHLAMAAAFAQIEIMYDRDSQRAGMLRISRDNHRRAAESLK